MTYIAVFAGVKISLTVPPATLKKAELKKPVRNLKIKNTAILRKQASFRMLFQDDNNEQNLQMWGGNATGQEKAKKMKYEIR